MTPEQTLRHSLGNAVAAAQIGICGDDRRIDELCDTLLERWIGESHSRKALQLLIDRKERRTND